VRPYRIQSSGTVTAGYLQICTGTCRELIFATLSRRQESVGQRDACGQVWKGEGKSGSQAGAHKLRQYQGL